MDYTTSKTMCCPHCAFTGTAVPPAAPSYIARTSTLATFEDFLTGSGESYALAAPKATYQASQGLAKMDEVLRRGVPAVTEVVGKFTWRLCLMVLFLALGFGVKFLGALSEVLAGHLGLGLVEEKGIKRSQEIEVVRVVREIVGGGEEKTGEATIELVSEEEEETKVIEGNPEEEKAEGQTAEKEKTKEFFVFWEENGDAIIAHAGEEKEKKAVFEESEEGEKGTGVEELAVEIAVAPVLEEQAAETVVAPVDAPEEPAAQDSAAQVPAAKVPAATSPKTSLSWAAEVEDYLFEHLDEEKLALAPPAAPTTTSNWADEVEDYLFEHPDEEKVVLAPKDPVTPQDEGMQRYMAEYDRWQVEQVRFQEWHQGALARRADEFWPRDGIHCCRTAEAAACNGVYATDGWNVGNWAVKPRASLKTLPS